MGLIVIDSDFMVMNGDWPSGKLSYNNGRSPCYWWGNELHGHWVCPRSWRYWSRHHLDDLGRNSLFRNPPTGDNGGILKTFFFGGGGGGGSEFFGEGILSLEDVKSCSFWPDIPAIFNFAEMQFKLRCGLPQQLMHILTLTTSNCKKYNLSSNQLKWILCYINFTKTFLCSMTRPQHISQKRPWAGQ